MDVLTRYWRCMLVLILIFICLHQSAADSETAASRLRSEYFRLRNNDPSGDSLVHRQSWALLADNIYSHTIRKPLDSNSARLRLLGTEAFMRLFRAARIESYLKSAQNLLAPICQGDLSLDREIVAQAFFLSGDIGLYDQKTSDALRAYRRAGELDANSAGVANQRILGIQRGTFVRFLPSSDFDVPRLVSGAQSQRHSKIVNRTVVLDPGHGGTDFGAISSLGGVEKEITLDIAKRVRGLLLKRDGLSVRMTRDSDRFVPLARRTTFANNQNGDVFVSLHVNASAGHSADGLEVYYLDNTNDEASRKLAERENGIDAGGGLDDISCMLSDLIQSGKLEDSILLSRAVEKSIRSMVLLKAPGLRSLGVKKAPFFVLVGAHMPCSLVEMFFVDNPVEGRKLRDPSFRELMASGIADGIVSFLLSQGVYVES